MFCSYCGEDHDESVVFTDEHVVPYAIGGSNALTIRVCEASNNALGGLVDKPFIENFLVRTKRFLMGLEGTDGTAPTLDLSGTKQISGHQVNVTYRISKESKLLKISSPTVTKTAAPNGERWTVTGDPTDVLRILEGKMESLNVQGKLMRDPQGKVLKPEDLVALAASRVKTLEPGILMQLHFDLLQFARFFAKLALATGHYAFGESFSRSAHADVLRKAMRASEASEWNIRGAQVWPNIQAVEPVLALFRKENSHMLGILPIEPPVFFANLFADIGAIIPLGELGILATPSPPCFGRVLQIVLPSREFHDQTLDQYASLLRAERWKERG